MSLLDMTVSKEEWAHKAKNVARFADYAATSEKGAYEGLPLLRKALMAMSNFDDVHRQAIVEFVLQWQERNYEPLWDTLVEMWKAHREVEENEA